MQKKKKNVDVLLLRALGLKNDAEIIKAFYNIEKVTLKDRKLFWEVSEGLIGNRISKSIDNPRTHEAVVAAGRKITAAAFKEIQKAKITQVEVASHDLEGIFTAIDIVDPSTGEVLVEANSEITPTVLNTILDSQITELQVFFPEKDDTGSVTSQTLKRDTLKTPQEALIEMYRKMRPGDPPTLDTATSLFNGNVLRSA